MTPDWTPLETELARWSAQGRTLPLWWRDDDAVAETPALRKLTELSERLGLPVHLAVIPAAAEESLAEAVSRTPTLVPLVHGWSHRNHAPEGEKKAEFGAHRPLEARVQDAARGLARLRALFGARLRPVFVPPWNRIAPDMAAALPALGYIALSGFTPRRAPLAAPGLAQVNCHLDPIDWRGSRSLRDPDLLISGMATQLADRREGRADAAEPFGMLTHHLAHDAAIWAFTEALLSRLMAGPVQAWTAPHLPKDMP